jgi:hypothetical protein
MKSRNRGHLKTQCLPASERPEMNCKLSEFHANQTTEQGTPLILFRTPFFGLDPMDLIVGRENRNCFTSDQDRLRQADVVVFHVPELRWSRMGETTKYPGQLWVAWSVESCINYPELADRSILKTYDLLMTYERRADVWVPYIPPLASWERALQSSVPLKTASAPVVMFQSDSIDKSGRTYFAAQLMRYIAVDSYGRFLRNRRLPTPDIGHQTKLETIGDYHFCLAFENSVAPDYVTEKIYDCLLAGVVPVYLGAPNVVDFVPPGSFISADAYGGPKDLASYLYYLLARPDEYAKYFAWRNKEIPAGMMSMLEATATHWSSRLVEAAVTRKEAPCAR